MDALKRNNVHVIGEGERTFLLAHGFGCDQNMWQFLVPQLTGHGRLVLFDFVGSGRSDISAYSRATGAHERPDSPPRRRGF